MRILDSLIIDCAGPEMLVARRLINGTVREFRSDSLRGQAEQLNQAIDRLAEIAPLAELEQIIVNRGPGSFTGIRVALATAYGLARGLERVSSLFPINSFAVHKTRMANQTEPFAIVLESRRPEKYCCEVHSGGLNLDTARVVDPLVQSDGANLITDITDSEITSKWPAACVSAALLTPNDYFTAVQTQVPEPISALYVRPPDVGPQPPKG